MLPQDDTCSREPALCSDVRGPAVPHLEHGGQVLAPAHEDAQVLEVQLAQAEQDALLLVAQVDAVDLQTNGARVSWSSNS